VTRGSPSQTLDPYAPKRATGIPLIVWIHGGAYLFGSKEFGAGGGCGLYADPEVAPTVKAFFATYLKQRKAALYWD